MKVRDLMAQPVVTIDCREVLADAIDLMRAREIHHLVVTDNGEAIGLLSAHDVARFESKKHVAPEVVQVGEAMSPEPYRVEPDAPLAGVAAEMAACGFGAALVVEHGRLVGVLTVRDCLRMLARLLGPVRGGDHAVA